MSASVGFTVALWWVRPVSHVVVVVRFVYQFVRNRDFCPDQFNYVRSPLEKGTDFCIGEFVRWEELLRAKLSHDEEPQTSAVARRNRYRPMQSCVPEKPLFRAPRFHLNKRGADREEIQLRTICNEA